VADVGDIAAGIVDAVSELHAMRKKKNSRNRGLVAATQ